ncbi:VpsF family polysaccharide biosynthesis protein [Sphingomonas sp.]|uniref:VpsF family polysaccharide biosynthesis protein n=1 Tax=Sphingomonas sp. TaxID=28214 RepID=UPI003B007B8F
MLRLLKTLTVIGCAMLFVLSFNVLAVLGWSIVSGNAITKLHPAFFILLLVAIAGVLSVPSVYARLLANKLYLFYLAAGILLVFRASFIAATGITGGELSAAIITWVLPAVLLLTLQAFSSPELDRIGVAIRIFFAVNSTMGLVERVRGTHFFPSLAEGIGDPRATAFFGHPLNASLLTGLMIVHLASARRSKVPVVWRLPEMGLHGIAMFAFGGRSAMVFSVAMVIFSAIWVRQEGAERKVGAIQRMLPLIIAGAGLALVFLPLDFVDATIDRFSNDYKSSETRNSAYQMLGFLNTHDWLFGMDANRRQIVQTFFHSPLGIELCWIALIMTYGIVAVLPMMVALPLLLYSIMRTLDRSAFYMMIYFLIVTAGSLSLGSKSLLIAQALMMMLALSQRRLMPARAGRREAPDIWSQLSEAGPAPARQPRLWDEPVAAQEEARVPSSERPAARL